MYDQNGLELSPISDAKTAYKATAANEAARNFSAIANAKHAKFRMQVIGKFADDRDAAFVGQEFAKLYDEHAVGQMVKDGVFRDVADEFLAGLDIPVWQFPSEGMSWDEMSGDETYTKNRVEGAREALVEAIMVFKLTPPPLKMVATLVKKVEQMYKDGVAYRDAAKQVLKVA